MIEKSLKRSIYWMLSYCLMASILSAIGKGVAEDMNVFEVVFFQNLFAMLGILPWWLFRKKSKKPRAAFKLHLGRAFFEVFAIALFFLGLTSMPLAEATAISFTGPLFTTIAAVIVLKESIGIHRIYGLAIGFIGMLIVIQPGMEAFKPTSFLLILAVSFWAGADIIIKIMGESESNTNQIFYLTLLMAAIALPIALTDWRTPTSSECFFLLLLGLTFILYATSLFRAFQHANLTMIMPISFTRLIFTALLDYAIFGELVGPLTVLGACIIIGSTVYITYREAQLHKPSAQSFKTHM